MSADDRTNKNLSVLSQLSSGAGPKLLKFDVTAEVAQSRFCFIVTRLVFFHSTTKQTFSAESQEGFGEI
jgi:hypothetical protein